MYTATTGMSLAAAVVGGAAAIASAPDQRSTNRSVVQLAARRHLNDVLGYRASNARHGVGPNNTEGST